MRFIIHELPYEKPVVAGLFRYERDGRPTGLVEHWRLTIAGDGYQFLRIDLDGRASTGESFIAHLTLDDDGRLERLSFRYWAAGPVSVGNLLLTAPTAMLAVDTGPERREEELVLPADCRLWLPTAAGLGLLLQTVWDQVTAVQLPTRPPFLLTQVEIARQPGPVDGSMTVQMGEQTQTAWLNAHGWPEKVVCGDGVTAVAARVIWYAR
jgi:hypothetical protein